MPKDSGLKPGTISTERLEQMTLECLQKLSEGALDHAGQVRATQVLGYRIELLENTIRALQGTIQAYKGRS
jgi:hypothetical protein